MSEPKTQRCPECQADWTGPAIPESSREFYGNETHFSRLIGIYDQNKDRTVAWRCPDCGHEWPRDIDGKSEIDR